MFACGFKAGKFLEKYSKDSLERYLHLISNTILIPNNELSCDSDSMSNPIIYHNTIILHNLETDYSCDLNLDDRTHLAAVDGYSNEVIYLPQVKSLCETKTSIFTYTHLPRVTDA